MHVSKTLKGTLTYHMYWYRKTQWQCIHLDYDLYFRYKHELNLATERERSLERSKNQMELDWQVGLTTSLHQLLTLCAGKTGRDGKKSIWPPGRTLENFN